MKFLKYLLFTIFLLYICLRIFNSYKENHLLSNEAVVSIYFDVKDENIDDYFDLPKGTYDKEKHIITCSFEKSDGFPLDFYFDLPIYRNKEQINCSETFSNEKHRRFNRIDIANYQTLQVRLFESTTASHIRRAQSSQYTIATVLEDINVEFGKINNIVLDGQSSYQFCK